MADKDAHVLADAGRSCALDSARTPESRSSAASAGLVYVSDCAPGIRRRGRPGDFTYEREDGLPTSEADRRRIQALAVPPAWTDVWICVDAKGHLQATGRDARGRKQYRYHARWADVRDLTKYDRMVEFGEALPRIRARVDADLRTRGLRREKVLAAVVGLLDRTLIRVGNQEYARANDSLGLSTLRDENVRIEGANILLRFRGKAGKEHILSVADRRLAAAVRRTRDLPGHELFQYTDRRGVRHVVGSGDVNDYLRDAGDDDLSSKDFRTWGGTLSVARHLAVAPVPAGRGGAGERAVAEAVREAADLLGNTPAVCRRSYVHPGVLRLYADGRLRGLWEEADDAEPNLLSDDERRLLTVLRRLRTEGPIRATG